MNCDKEFLVVYKVQPKPYRMSYLTTKKNKNQAIKAFNEGLKSHSLDDLEIITCEETGNEQGRLDL
jgi:hypothetical protein